MNKKCSCLCGDCNGYVGPNDKTCTFCWFGGCWLRQKQQDEIEEQIEQDKD